MGRPKKPVHGGRPRGIEDLPCQTSRVPSCHGLVAPGPRRQDRGAANPAGGNSHGLALAVNRLQFRTVHLKQLAGAERGRLGQHGAPGTGFSAPGRRPDCGHDPDAPRQSSPRHDHGSHLLRDGWRENLKQYVSSGSAVEQVALESISWPVSPSTDPAPMRNRSGVSPDLPEERANPQTARLPHRPPAGLFHAGVSARWLTGEGFVPDSLASGANLRFSFKSGRSMKR